MLPICPLRSAVFTGLIEYLGTVERKDCTPAGVRLWIRPDAPDPAQGALANAAVGDSIAVDGCCLTLAAEPAKHGGLYAFDVIPESLAKTTLGSFEVGTRVHLEPSATMATLLGGHLVQGHVDGVGTVLQVQRESGWRVRIAVPRTPEDLLVYFVPKGSVALQGVSLTIAAIDVNQGWFEVALIPTTLAKTTLGALKAGSKVNLECDAMAKTVLHYLKHFGNR